VTTIERHGPAAVQEREGDVAKVYESAWASMPFAFDRSQVRNFVKTFSYHAEKSGFRLCIGRDKGAVAGFAYGYSSEPGGWWREQVQKAIDRRLVHTWLADSFELAELAVAQGAQGRGMGARLHDAILDGLPHRAAVLSTQRDNARALGFYRRRGWKVLSDGVWFPHRKEPFVVLALDLSTRGPARPREI
jgi:ribosomal protein S18 acetylase RimI-like enzyme